MQAMLTSADAYPDYVPSVMAGNDLVCVLFLVIPRLGNLLMRVVKMRSAFGASFPLFAHAMFRNLGVGWASSTLGFISILFIPIPFVLYKVRTS